MTRFKELRQLEQAIAHSNRTELNWARNWCQGRLSSATRKDHRKHWSGLIKRVEAALSDCDDSTE